MEPNANAIDEFVFVVVNHVIPAVPIERNAHHPEESMESVTCSRNFKVRFFLYDKEAITERVEAAKCRSFCPGKCLDSKDSGFFRGSRKYPRISSFGEEGD